MTRGISIFSIADSFILIRLPCGWCDVFELYKQNCIVIFMFQQNSLSRYRLTIKFCHLLGAYENVIDSQCQLPTLIILPFSSIGKRISELIFSSFTIYQDSITLVLGLFEITVDGLLNIYAFTLGSESETHSIHLIYFPNYLKKIKNLFATR